MKITVKQIFIHVSLLLMTFVTTTLAGTEWMYGKSIFMPGFTMADFISGMPYSIPFLTILTAHEFGHYFMALRYKIKVTLPYYIPLPPFPFMLGTLGALIRLKSRVVFTVQHFDIGIAGPLAGFVVTLGVLGYGFTHLPPPEYIFQFHPEYQVYGLEYANYVYDATYLSGDQSRGDVTFGKSILYIFFEKFLGDVDRVPNVHEIMHYPYLFAGFLSLIFTSINLLPIGQLDGGHVLYGLLGFEGHKKVARMVFVVFLFYAGLGYVGVGEASAVLIWKIPLFIGFLYICLAGLRLNWKGTLLYALAIFVAQYSIVAFFPAVRGYPGWLLFAFIVGRFIGIQHPLAGIEQHSLSRERRILGWIALLIFIVSFSPNPIEITLSGVTSP